MPYFSEQRSLVRLPLSIDPNSNTGGLRRAQLGAITAIQSRLTLGMSKPGLIVMPTGSGKTGVLMMAPFLLDSTRVLVITPSRIVRYQIAEDFRTLRTLKAIGAIDQNARLPSVIEVDKRRRTTEGWAELRPYDVAIATPASVSPAYKDIVGPPEDLFDLILVDEAHHSPATTWQSVLKSYPAAKRLLFTATPFRRDERVIEGEFLYVFPVADAYKDEIFSHIEYIPVTDDPSHPETRDELIAKEAEAVLTKDRSAGFPHSLMVRTDTKAKAEELLDLYGKHTNLNLAVVHSSLSFSIVKNITDKLRGGEIDGVICVDMLGEGYDLPNLKIAAIHAPHKSLSVLLQYIGRFSRPGDGTLGSAKFLAIPSDIEVDSVSLYSESAAWQDIIPGMIDAGVSEEVKRKRTIGSFAEWGHDEGDGDFEEVSLFGMKPYFHIRAYRVTPPIDLEVALEVGPNQRIAYRWSSPTESATVMILETLSRPRWTNMSLFPSREFSLVVVYLSAAGQFLFINCSEEERGNDQLFLSLAGQFSPNGFSIVDQDMAKRSLSGVDNLNNFMVGLRNHQFASGIETYRIMTGPSANRAVQPVDGEMYLLGHSYGKGIDNGNEVTIGWSGSGKVWSNRSSGIPELLEWCEALAKRFVLTGPVVTNSEIDHLRSGTRISTFPSGCLTCDWPQDFYARLGLVEYQTDDGHKRQCDQHELTVEVDRLTSNADEIRFSVIADELDAHFSFRLDRTPFIQPANATARDLAIVRSRSNIPLSAYFRVHPPAFFFADFSYVIGDLLFPAPDNNLSHFSDQQIETVNWDAENVLITQEYGDCLPNISIHDYIEGRLKGEQCDIVFFDHLSPEAADFITLKEFAERIELCFYHCKGSSRKEPASRSEDLIEVVGQAGKSVRWLHNLSALRGKIDKRVKLKPERFIVGTLAEFDRLVLAARTKQLHLVVVAVQPGLSKQQMDDPASSLLGATDAYLVRARCSHLRVIGSE